MIEPSLFLVTLLYMSIVFPYGVMQDRYARRYLAAHARTAGCRWPSVDVVLPCWNEEPRVLAECCRSLELQDYPGELQAFVVDDGSHDSPALDDVYRRYRGRQGWRVILLSEHLGKRSAQDAAVGLGCGQLIVTIDSDTVLESDAVRRLVLAFADADVGAVTGDVRALNRNDNWLTRLVDQRYRLLFERERAAQSHVGAVLCCSGPFSAYRRIAVERIWSRYLNQTFMGQPCMAGDDIHLTNLVLASGYRSLYEPSAKARTIVPTTLRHYARQQVRWNRSFYRELVPTLQALRGRSRYLLLDVTARLVLPLLLTAGIVLTGLGLHAASGRPVRALVGVALLAAMGASGARLLVGKTAHAGLERDFVLRYGLIYLFLLIPVRFWSLATLLSNGWGPRGRAPCAAGGRVGMVAEAAADAAAEAIAQPAEPQAV